MAEVLFPVSLSSLIKDYDKTFWDGKGSVSITLNELAQIIEGNPKVTLALLKQQRDQLGKSPVVYSGLKIAAAAETPVSLGDKQNLSLKLSFDAEVNGGLTIILNPEGLKQLPEELGDNLNALLSRYVSLSGEEGVLFLFLTGALSAGVEGSNMLIPALNVGFHFEAGAGFECGHCLPVAGEAQLLQAISDVFSGIRLPQTSLMHLKNKGRPVGLGKNELLYSSYNGFLSLGVNATFSYSFNGTKNVSLGKLDLATKLIVQAEAALSLDYQMAGAFRISVRMGDTPEWLRVVVEKVHSSTFDFAFGVTAGAQLITPETGSGGLALIESVIGTKPAQILHKALEYGSTSIQQWRQKADYFTQALAEKWAGKGVDTVFAAIADDSLEIIFGAMQKVETAINDIDDDLVSLYEELIDNESLPGFLDDLRALFQQADPALQKQKLLDIIKNKEIKQMVETLAGQAVGSIYTQCENLHQYLQKRFLQLDELVNGGVKKEIREFVAAKKSALHLDSLVTELAKYDSPTKMKSHATTAAKGLVERLLDKPFDSIFVEQGLAARLVGEVNTFATGFRQLVEKVGDLVHNALNAKGRFELSYDYQCSKEKENLVDIQYHIGSADNPDETGMKLYQLGVDGDFKSVLKEEYVENNTVKIESATFTDTIQKKKILDVHIFGWDHKGVSTMLNQLDLAVQTGGTGLVTLYKLTLKGKRISESRRKTTELNHMLQLAGTAAGVFTSSSEYRKQAIDAFENLRSMQNRFDYVLKDNIASLEELQVYFDFGVRLNIIDGKKMANLIETIKTLRSDNAADDFMKVSVKYTVSYESEALANALAFDYSTAPQYEYTGSSRAALERIHVNRILFGSFIHSGKSDDEIAIDYLFGKKEIFDKFKVDPNMLWKNSYQDRVTFTRDGKKHTVTIKKSHFEWARILYFRNVWFAAYLEKFRKALANHTQMAFQELEAFLQKSDKKAKQMVNGPSYINALPFMVLDEMVLLSNGDKPGNRTALMEIILYDKSGEKELSYIPISS